ncbi:3-deoxy-D-manno-octulosonic acid transferase [Tabrizicola sp.]|uniref:3-deoxy-D-manno-octulosonic acid transferase n=1 Tax=Tabrizicola sp. TaxID=2005166 RepID=UPI002605F311|nr:3-deoxy-D-manno-octulosonic acid transferase [Tabrizicola sp.]MDM7932007.1 3-deoxy-D-manno-octulosonic acid transferase [Tabrizicola sp.]
MKHKVNASALPRTTRIVYVGIQVLAHLALPVLAFFLAIRAVREPAHLRHLSHRLGLGPVGPQGAVWIYAASLGETRAASPLIRQLVAAGHPVLLAHLSPAGMAEGWRLFPDQPLITHRYMPLDLFWAVQLFLRRARPKLGLVLEVEIWPAMMIEATRAGVPMVMVNGNLLDRSMGAMRGARRHLMALYRLFSQVYTRDAAYRARYLTVGVPPERIEVVGEMKYDQWIDPSHLEQGKALRARWTGAARVLMIASSVKDEEPILLPMITRLLAADPGLRVIWAPRSPQRFSSVAEGLAAAGVSVVRRTALGAEVAGPMPDAKVLVGDSTGEMNIWYAMADLVFVGASLVDHGGHNIMEPMALGCPVVMGPSTYGVASAVIPATRAGAMNSLPDADALESRVLALLADATARATMGRQALAFASEQTGAAARTLAGLQPMLTGPCH